MNEKGLQEGYAFFQYDDEHSLLLAPMTVA